MLTRFQMLSRQASLLHRCGVLLTISVPKTHRRDQFIEWIKGLLAVPFVLASKPAAVYDERKDKNLANMATSAHQRYADIFRDIEALVLDHIKHQDSANPRSKLIMLVPTVSKFFTPLNLVEAFEVQDSIRAISSRRFVPPSFNDIRLILNTSQIIHLIRAPSGPGLQLLTFDGDVTLYEDGGSLLADEKNGTLPPIVHHLLYFLSRSVKIGIVTAAGHTEKEVNKYYKRLSGLLDAVASSQTLTIEQKSGLIIMGGESNFLFVFDQSSDNKLRYIHRRNWIVPEMRHWAEPAIQSLLDAAEVAFKDCVKTLHLTGAIVLRKERAVGIYKDPSKPETLKLNREQLEETVLVVQQILEAYSEDLIESGKHPLIPWTVFNGGNDVFMDIGDKSLGVQACQKWFGGIKPGNTLHVGDQFLSGGGNDFKARDACCTSWIASPLETSSLLEMMIEFGEKNE